MNGKMNVTDGLGQAVEHTKRVLFRPFDFGKWVCFGVIIFLDVLFQGGGGGGGGGGFNRPGGPDNIADGVNSAREWVVQHLVVVLPVVAVVFVIIIGLTVLFMWLRSHGTMMLIRAVALNDSDIGENWRRTRQAAFSVFIFRIVLAAAGFVVFGGFCLMALLTVLSQAARGTDAIWPYVVSLLPIVFIWICLGLAFWLAETLLRNFVAPLMFHFDLSCVEAWKHFRGVCRGNIPMLFLFLVIRFAYFIAFGIATVLIGCVTCCIGFLPVIHHTLFAPFYVFDRSYSLYVLESLGPDFRIIQPAPPDLIPEMPSSS